MDLRMVCGTSESRGPITFAISALVAVQYLFSLYMEYYHHVTYEPQASNAATATSHDSASDAVRVSQPAVHDFVTNDDVSIRERRHYAVALGPTGKRYKLTQYAEHDGTTGHRDVHVIGLPANHPPMHVWVCEIGGGTLPTQMQVANGSLVQ